MDMPLTPSVSRGDLLKVGRVAGLTGAAGSYRHLFDLSADEAQALKRGGTFRLRIHVAPVHFDPQQTVAFPTMQAMSLATAAASRSKPAPQ